MAWSDEVSVRLFLDDMTEWTFQRGESLGERIETEGRKLLKSNYPNIDYENEFILTFERVETYMGGCFEVVFTVEPLPEEEE